jgi:hypothetical protein
MQLLLIYIRVEDGDVICNMMVGCSVDIKLITDVSHNLGEHLFVC